MEPLSINWLALIVAVVAKQAIGALWFSPLLFARPWSRATGIRYADMQAGLAKALIPDVIGSGLMAFVLGQAEHYAGAHGVLPGALVGFWCWLGFAAVATLPSVTFERRPSALYLINNGFLLLALMVMGAILAAWPT